MEINLTKDSVVDNRTGEVSAPSEYVENLRLLEVTITRADEAILEAKADLKTARDDREKAVAQLRAAVREGAVLPLLEIPDDDDDDTANWDGHNDTGE